VKPLAFDPITEAHRQWIEHEWTTASDGMALVTSIMRVQQIFLSRVDKVLRTYGLTFARFELLSLVSFTRSGALPLSKAGDRLQVHPTSITNSVDRLEADGLVRRRPHETDRRMTLVEILPAGRGLVAQATTALNEKVFCQLGVPETEASTLFELLRNIRFNEGDFSE
jgi:DNA-binding MarR family transcriptional regulator